VEASGKAGRRSSYECGGRSLNSNYRIGSRPIFSTRRASRSAYSLVEELKDFPLCLVYKADGTCIFRGSPFDAEPSVRLAVGEAIVAAANVDTPPKQLELLVDALRKGKAPSTIYARLSPMAKSKDPDLAAAASLAIIKKMETELSGKAGATNPRDPVFRYENALHLRQLNLAVI
jgi:hypothetical protein